MELGTGNWKLGKSKSGGYTTLVALFVTLGVSLTIIAGFTFFTLQEIRSSRIFTDAAAGRAAAEGGIEDRIYRIVGEKQIGDTETLAVGMINTTTSLTLNNTQRVIRSEGRIGNLRQIYEARVDVVRGPVSFSYGAHIGRGGIVMENTAKVIGSVYSNGDINAAQSAEITGDAFAAGASRIIGNPAIGGSAYAYAISNATIGGYASSTTLLDNASVAGDAHAETIAESEIGKDAYYQTSITNTKVGGATHPNTLAPPPLPEIPLSISDEQIAVWEAKAEAGGTHTGPCPYEISGGVVNLGPRKIACDLAISGSGVVILNGPLWIAGNFEMKNNAVMQLTSSYGSGSEVVIADNPVNRTTSSKITMQNSAKALGSGANGSYIVLISQNNSAEQGGDEAAIEPKNGADAATYYAGHGEILIQNTTTLKEASAYRIRIKNSAALTYESGLANIRFSSGPTGGYGIVYWKRAE